MFDPDRSEAKTRPFLRVAAVLLTGLLLLWAGPKLGHEPFWLVPIVGAALVLAYLFDLAQLPFAGIAAARRKVQGVEHGGRHEWHAFRGQRVRVFLDEYGAPWFSAREIAAILEVKNPAEALLPYGRNEAAEPAFAKGERCLSESGLRRMIRHSRHPEAPALGLWLEREVLFTLGRRKSG